MLLLLMSDADVGMDVSHAELQDANDNILQTRQFKKKDSVRWI